MIGDDAGEQRLNLPVGELLYHVNGLRHFRDHSLPERCYSVENRPQAHQPAGIEGYLEVLLESRVGGIMKEVNHLGRYYEDVQV